MSRVPAVLSVDFEFFHHLPAYRAAAGTTDESAVGLDGVDALLAAFDDADASGTFFTVSDVAEDSASVLERIVDDGHELASHTHTHPHLSDVSAAERREELATSKERLESVGDTSVVGFRAPSFDVPEGHFRMLADLGYDYDSSVVPCRSIPGWYGGEYDTRRPSPASVVDPSAPDGLAELPVAVMPALGLPLTGTWIRFFGVRYTILGMRWLARRGIAPVLYVHPWELVDLPDVEGVPARVYWRTGSYMHRAVRRILDEPFEFVTARSLADEVEAQSPADAVGARSPADGVADGDGGGRES